MGGRSDPGGRSRSTALSAARRRAVRMAACPNTAVIERQEDVARHLSSNTEATELLRLEIAEAVAAAR